MSRMLASTFDIPNPPKEIVDSFKPLIEHFGFEHKDDFIETLELLLILAKIGRQYNGAAWGSGNSNLGYWTHTYLCEHGFNISTKDVYKCPACAKARIEQLEAEMKTLKDRLDQKETLEGHLHIRSLSRR